MKEEQWQHQNEKPKFFGLKHEDEKRLHPHALKRFNDWKAEIIREVPQLDHLDIHEINADINTHLKDTEKDWAAKHKDNISAWLWKCIDIGKGYSCYSPVYDTSVISDMYGLKRLVKTAYESKAKAEKKKAEAEEKNRQWDEAVSHVYPLQLSKDAGRYLSNDDQEKLLEAVGVAIKIYLKQGDGYLDNYKTFDYRWYLRKINNEKEKERRHLDAQAQAQAFRPRLDQGLEEIERKLSPKQEAPAVIFKRWCSNKGENRYLEEPFTDILASEDDEKRNWTQGYIPSAEEELQKFIPEELRNFILAKPKATFFLLPDAHYSHCGVPCLDFYFDVFAVISFVVSAQAGQKVFNGYKFNFLNNLREPKPLGIYKIIITSNEPHFWQSVPIGIIHALVGGNLQPPNTTILQRTDQLTVYEVKKFEEDICEIPISFERYCRSLGSVKKMEELGIIKKRTAEILELPQPIINQKESKSKKAQAFALFSQGKRPGDGEVKYLGIKPNSAYRYYQDWKKAQDNNDNPT